MPTTVLVELPDVTYQSAAHLAQLTHRTIGETLADVVVLSLPSLAGLDPADLTTLTDGQVLRLTQITLPTLRDERLTVLLDRQQTGALLPGEPAELARLMQIYQESLLVKAHALAEAVRRGLIPSLAG